jgi:hypothetical protein
MFATTKIDTGAREEFRGELLQIFSPLMIGQADEEFGGFRGSDGYDHPELKAIKVSFKYANTLDVFSRRLY